MERKDGGPAFFLPCGDYSTENSPGITLRDYFAAAALTGLLGGDFGRSLSPKIRIAESVYLIADEMLAARATAQPRKP